MKQYIVLGILLYFSTETRLVCFVQLTECTYGVKFALKILGGNFAEGSDKFPREYLYSEISLALICLRDDQKAA